jgi:uncharacterized protein YggE
MDAQTPDSMIVASAHRTWRLAPDRATLYIAVTGAGETAAEAVAAAQAEAGQMMQLLSQPRLKIVAEPPMMVTTGRERDMNARPGTPVPLTARSVIRVHAEHVESLPELLATVIDAGATLSSIRFESSTADSIRQARLPVVVAAAQSEAAAIAQALGGRLGSLIEVTVFGGPGSGYTFPVTLSSGSFGEGMTVPEINIASNVTVRYQLLR